MKKAIIGLFCFVIAGASVFFGIEFITKTGFFKEPGELLFSEDFSESEKEHYQEMLKDISLKENLNFSYSNVSNATSLDSDSERWFLFDVLVPFDDFYSSESSISSSELEKRLNTGDGLVSIRDLDSTKKLLGVDGNYFLDSFSGGGIFKYLVVKGDRKEDLDAVSDLLHKDSGVLPDATNTLSFAQTGVTAFGRGMNTMMNTVGNGHYFSEKIGEFLRSFDLTHTSNEASFSEQASSANICADERFMDTLTDIGLDVVELTGNHNLDCGAEDAIATVEKYEAAGIKIVGGGRDAEEAAKPLEIEQKGNKITVLAYNQSTGGATTGDTPGANQYNAIDAKERITEAKQRGDIVIVDVQYFECSEYDSVAENTACDYANSSDGDQIGLFRGLIDMGADVVVGTSAHQTQTYEMYNTGEIYYGLGNIFFDQSWWPGTTRSLGLVHYFWNGKLLQTRRFGTVYDGDLQTRLMSDDELSYLIERLNNARPTN